MFQMKKKTSSDHLSLYCSMRLLPSPLFVTLSYASELALPTELGGGGSNSPPVDQGLRLRRRRAQGSTLVIESSRTPPTTTRRDIYISQADLTQRAETSICLRRRRSDQRHTHIYIHTQAYAIPARYPVPAKRPRHGR